MSSLATLRTQVRRYVLEEDSSNSHFTDAELNDYLNQAVLFLGTQMEWPIKTAQATSVSGQTLYTLPDDFISLLDVYFDNVKMSILEREDLSSVSTQWQNDPNGLPTYCYKADNNVIGLYRTPDDDNASKAIQIQYVGVPDTLVTDTDVPDLHSAFQMCLPFYAAFLCDYKLGNDKKADMHLQNYEQHRKALMSKVQRFSDDLLRFRWSW